MFLFVCFCFLFVLFLRENEREKCRTVNLGKYSVLSDDDMYFGNCLSNAISQELYIHTEREREILVYPCPSFTLRFTGIIASLFQARTVRWTGIDVVLSH